MSRTRLAVVAASALLGRPRLWPTALRQLRRFAPDGWWRRWPHLPVPDAGLLELRAVAQYGDSDHGPEAADLVTWLRWCRSEDRLERV